MTRRSLTQVGGQVQVWAGEAEFGKLLDAALRVETEESAVMQHVHGFHTYPARMHPDTAARLVQGLSQPHESVLDPFMGSGTVLVEARALGRRALGIDANPLAVALTELKLFGIAPAQRELFIGAADAVAEHADVRRCAKAGPSRRYSTQDRAMFDPHVLLELDGLIQGVEQICPEELRPVFMLVLSSMIIKVSRRRSDTSDVEMQRRLASGFAIRFFAKKSRELLTRLDEYARRLPLDCPQARIALGDARELPVRNSSVSTIVTSPPYPGVYDYVEHHRLRMEWLKLDVRHLERHEIGAHRHFAQRDDDSAEAEWAAQLGACLAEMARVLVPNGTAAILIADSAVAGRAWYADRALRELAPQYGFSVAGGASQRRGHFHAPTHQAFNRAERREHLIVLRRATTNPRSVTAPIPTKSLEHRNADSNAGDRSSDSRKSQRGNTGGRNTSGSRLTRRNADNKRFTGDDSENGNADNRNADNRNADNRNADNRNADNRNADNRNADNRNADNRNADNRNAGSSKPLLAGPGREGARPATGGSPAQGASRTAPNRQRRQNGR